MKKREPDPRQIELDLGFPEEPAPLPDSGAGSGASGSHGAGRAANRESGRGSTRGSGRGSGRGSRREPARNRQPDPDRPAAGVESDWVSLQEQAPEAIPAPVPARSADAMPTGDGPELDADLEIDGDPYSEDALSVLEPPRGRIGKRASKRLPLSPSSAPPMPSLPRPSPQRPSPPMPLPPDPDSWTEPVDPCPVVKPAPDEAASDEAAALELSLPQGPVDFSLPTSIAWAGRRPYSPIASLLQPGDPVRLRREPDNPHDPHAIRIENDAGEAAGYLYADEASWLSLLFDVAPPARDDSVVIASDGRHVHIEIRLHLDDAWPLFTIVAIFGLRSERFASAFNLPGNPFLEPLAALNRQFLANYDYFQMPPTIVEAYASLRQRFHARQTDGSDQGLSLHDSDASTSER